MAATRIIPLHTGKGKTIAKALNDRLDYSQNPDKTDDRKYVSSYECDPKTAAEEFALSKKDSRAEVIGQNEKRTALMSSTSAETATLPSTAGRCPTGFGISLNERKCRR